MIMKKLAALGLAAVILLAPLGCATQKRLAVNMASDEFNCPKEKIQVKEIGPDLFQVLACGNFANYRCDKFTKVCAKQEGEVQ